MQLATTDITGLALQGTHSEISTLGCAGARYLELYIPPLSMVITESSVERSIRGNGPQISDSVFFFLKGLHLMEYHERAHVEDSV